MFSELVKRNRSYRRFDAHTPIPHELLLELVELTRFTASAANRQALRYVILSDPHTNELLYPQLHWAAYLKDWNGPEEKERPTGYILLTQKKDQPMASPYDAGIAAQTILLGAVEKGFGGCILASIEREKIKTLLQLPAKIELLLVIALGKPKEEVVLEDISASGNIQYYRDAQQTHHVPKYSLKDLLL